MTDLTALDTAHAAMAANDRDEAARLRFYERLADSELFLLLSEEAVDESVSPELFELSDHSFVLVFDREERLAQFVGQPAPYAALSGRVIAGLLADQGIGLGVNLEVAPSSILIPPEAVEWLAQTLGHGPDEAEARIEEVGRPQGLPEALLTALDAKLATAGGLAHAAYLVAARYDGGGNNHLLAFVDAVPGAEGALAKAVAEALTFSGIEAGALDVSFVRASEPLAAKLAQWGLRFDLPHPQAVAEVQRAAPGSDPAKPPILR
ncbi:SseB family protein [Thalassovita taeanensis]|uniref:SseB protein N-terminal domain-containing protein n=1 Tax=Thalassovita taeanensis TaxID=657014 RepID=A0A1H9DEF5_9RHOB|nr:SseB family protein [Thalassovita taeanensis]SEQ11128.1 SseB protein N-terminal domain-containing protein [Thalassovita taeanensis]